MLYKGNKIKFALVFTLVLILLVSLINPSNPAFAKNDKDPVEGAIYTTNKEGTENNKQHYTNKEEVYLYVNGNKFSNDHYYIRILSSNKKEVLGVSQEPLYITNEGENIYRLWDLVSYEDENGNIIQGYKDTKNPGGVYKIEISKDKNFDTSLDKSETFKVGVGKPDDPGNPEDPGDNENPEKPKEPEIPKQTEDPEEIIQIEDNEIPIGIPETLPQTSETIPYLSYIAGGILIILGNSIKKYNEYKSNQILMEIEKNMEFEKKKSIPTEKPSETPKPISNTLIKIDKIDLKLPIVEGISEKSLKYAIGSFRKDLMPGDVGNYSLAGHRNYTYGKMFNRLNELEKGDLIEIKKEDKSFYYKVSQILIVDPEEIWVLKDEKDKKTITLITCHPIGIANQRLIIKGELRE